MLRKQFSNDRNERKRNLHHSLGLIRNGCFVFRNRFIFRLFFVVAEYSLHSFCIPTWGKPFLFHDGAPHPRC
jgi:hypothetical protein